jgi:gamma-glutamylcyclotransferase (GGCT)/AIG2-like uncharacterized protein YtfP
LTSDPFFNASNRDRHFNRRMGIADGEFDILPSATGRTGTLNGELLAVYGTLRRRSLFQRGPLISQKLGFLCSGHLRGKLFWQKNFPAAVEGYGVIPVEIFRILDPAVWEHLDQYEGCDMMHEPGSLFYRKKVRLLRPSLVAWVYLLGHRNVRGNPIALPGRAPVLYR